MGLGVGRGWDWEADGDWGGDWGGDERRMVGEV